MRRLAGSQPDIVPSLERLGYGKMADARPIARVVFAILAHRFPSACPRDVGGNVFPLVGFSLRGYLVRMPKSVGATVRKQTSIPRVDSPGDRANNAARFRLAL